MNTGKMKKRHLVLILFFVYAIFLLALAGQYETDAQNSIVNGFFNSFSESLGLVFRYITISFLSSSAYLIFAYLIQNKLSFLFVLLAPFLNVAVAFVVGVLLSFVLWITQLEEVISIFQKVFIIATISTLGTTLWLLRDMFKTETELQDMRTR
jgi:uncharacterized membrane protein